MDHNMCAICGVLPAAVRVTVLPSNNIGPVSLCQDNQLNVDGRSANLQDAHACVFIPRA
jgi:hypothetical protein